MTQHSLNATDAQTYSPLTPKLLMQLAAPHTWPASIMPVLVGTSLAVAHQGTVSLSLMLVLLAIVVLLQAAVNTFNDYTDFKKGADTADNQMDPDDAVLVFNKVNPLSVKRFALILVALALLLGSYVIYCAGWIPLMLGLIGIFAVWAYSGGKLPVSYLPLGEFVSGFVMGCLALFATYHALTLDANPVIMLFSLPTVISIALIMMTNNTCDIEKDRIAQRKTMPALAGRERARKVYHVLFYTMVVLVLVIGALWFTPGLVLAPFMLLALYPFGKLLMANPLVLESRVAAMGQVFTVNVVMNVFYAAIILSSSFIWIVP